MDPSNRDDPPASLFTTTTASCRSTNPPPFGSNLNLMSPDPNTTATPIPASPPMISPSSLLSPSDGPARSPAIQQQQQHQQQQRAPRRTPSSNSLRDENRKSSPSLQKRSSTASLRSARNSGGSTSPRPSLSRRSSSNFATSPPTTNHIMLAKRSSLPAAPENPMPTSASIAAEHFQKEMEMHKSADLQSKTLVVVHDDCYGHRFSRPRTSKAALGTIVERPERIRAGVLGVSAAYVRLGRRHAGGRFAPHPNVDLPRLPVPPFQIRKTARSLALTSPAVTHVHGSKWMDDLKNMCDVAESRLALNGKELARPRSAGRDSSSASGPALHEGDLYLCSESLNAFEGALGGVCEGVDAVFGPNSTQRAFVCIRPPGHHCSSGHPSGFCWINNVHVGISYAAMIHGLTHAAILDFDLHHGDGSQDIAWQQNSKAITAAKNAASHKKTMIGYYSLHDINSYPCEIGDLEKVRNASVCIDKAHGQSIWNIHLEPWKTDSEFWELYASKYALLIEKARAFLRLHTERLASLPNGPQPKAAIFISAGFDASEWEGAGMQRHKVNVPTDFYAKFTADIVKMAQEEGLGTDGRVISVLEGGYSDRALTSGILSHLAGMGDTTTGTDSADEDHINHFSSDMTGRLGLSDSPPTDFRSPKPKAAFNTDWWAPTLLEELEALVYPPVLVTKPREKSTPTYFAPTQSFTAKVVNPSRDRRSNSSAVSLETEAPLPEVGWATATHELSKILIPSYRQTMSCRPEELNAEASRVRKERQAAAEGIVTPAPTAPTAPAVPEEGRMKLRTRKPKSSLPSTPKMESPKQQVLKGNRRTTIDPASDLPDASLDKSLAARAGRRKSTPSTPVTDAGAHEDDDEQRTLSCTAIEETNPGTSRPGTAASNRSSTSTTTRRTSTTRSTPKRSASPKTVPPVPRVPSGFLSNPSSGQGEQTELGSHSVSVSQEISTPDDIDSLAAGVRKLNIKLKVPSPEENAAREKKAAEQRKKSMPKGSSKTPKSPKRTNGAKTSRTSMAKSVVQSNPQPSALQTTSAQPETDHSVREENQEPTVNPPNMASVTSSPAMSSIPDSVTVGRPGRNIPTNVSTQAPALGSAMSPPLTPGTTNDTVRPQLSIFSPPTSAAQAKSGLPTFTSTGPIPFAPPSAVNNGSQSSSESRSNSLGYVAPGNTHGSFSSTNTGHNFDTRQH
ncbi:hypothetical protein AWENTII_002507 [Aspergillus wentii]|nr:hypothetical protein MW887_007907 [Aspergillus wentii]